MQFPYSFWSYQSIGYYGTSGFIPPVVNGPNGVPSRLNKGLIPTLTSNIGSNGVISSDSIATPSFDAWMACDGDDTTFWSSQNEHLNLAWIQYAFNTPQLARSYLVLNTIGQTFNLSGSSDAVNWSLLAANVNTNGVTGVPIIMNNFFFKYYRLAGTQNLSVNGLRVNTFQLYGF